MSIIKSAAILLWRIWFYILMVVPIIIMLPFLLIFTSSEKFYPQFFVCARIWSKIIIYGMGFRVKMKADQILEKHKSYMLVANHTSMLDIMLMLTVIKQPFVFIGKKELGRIPVFGFFYRRTCILVDRNNQKSRMAAFEEAQRRLKQENSVCIFPEGGVPNDTSIILDQFKDGAFRLALDHKIPIVPITFHDNKKRFSYKFFSGSPGKLRVKIHNFIETKSLETECRKVLKEKTRKVILDELKDPTVV
ncbi:lysophospholipid acyltransferase family protein [Christiangramia sabulilitoris]|uniref:1-acyl-sn-glycerol-3-phosphate acyltransferase n=1 Tax=Christiangramia sabulilitoris TaxID=2583991 RepID=A0A550I8N2_9FLAO|nr:lysophospholipid acyltransferase family protein [Christiangramia sabulilitoris]TRO67331.1 1-acyl-sn-glycerol-3-phosphate acyltransferase [Christiangramia sabulilitoris]